MLINHIRTNQYFDSVSLMVLSTNLNKGEGVTQASVMMGTPSNKQILKDAGLLLPEGESAAPQDMITAVCAESEEALEWAKLQVEAFLHRENTAGDENELGEYRPKSLDTAIKHAPRSNIVSLSIAGEYAQWEAELAIRKGLHVFCFSDNIGLAAEKKLKQLASDRGLFMMGPDCGTALIQGTALGFCNAVRRGSIGLIGASGTGLQEVMCQIDLNGGGISHAIGIGGRDFHPEIGGLMADMAYRALCEDAMTETIVIVSKPADRKVIMKLLNGWSELNQKPTVMCFVGMTMEERGAILADLDIEAGERYRWANSLMNAAELAVSMNRSDHIQLASDQVAAASSTRDWFTSNLQPGQKAIRGLYCGGTLCYEAATMLTGIGQPVSSNVHYRGVLELSESFNGHVLIDYGDDAYTVGTPHPMIYPNVRNQAIVDSANRPEVGVILFDIVLGYGAHEDPSESVIDAVREARAVAEASGYPKLFIAALCGTEKDLQQAGKQQSKLETEGIIVFRGHAAAVKFAVNALNVKVAEGGLL